MQAPASKDQIFAPYERYRTMRATQPVYYDEERHIWHVFSYRETSRILSDYATFSSDPRTLDAQRWVGDLPPLLASILRMDPPRHRQMRNIASSAFTPRMVAQMAPRISAITNELLDQVASAGQMDVIKDLAYPLPVTVIAELLGVPAEQRADFKRWSDALVSGFNNEEERAARLVEIRSMYAYFTEVLEERRQHPENDLISALLAAEVEGQRLSDNELLGFCALLLVAGNETTTNLIGNSMLCFDQHPEAVELMRNDSTLIPGAIEEVLRYLSPVKAMNRFTKSEVELGGRQVGARQVVFAWLGSANRDEEQFPSADTFDIQRTPNRHLAFGYGIHFCLGAPLARLEAKIVLEAMLSRCPGRWRIPDVPLEPIDSIVVFGVKSLPMTWGE